MVLMVKRWVLAAAEARVAPGAGPARSPAWSRRISERVADRPGGQVEAPSSRRITQKTHLWPGCSDCTPAVTIFCSLQLPESTTLAGS